MLFNSIEFLLFMIIFFLIWPLVRKRNNMRWGFITLASFVFYGWWDWRFLFLLLFSGLVDYAAGLLMTRYSSNKGKFLLASVVSNLGILSVFKYSAFFANILEQLIGLTGITVDLVSKIPEFTIILPVGISFYTFQSLSYTVDIYRGRLKPASNIFHFFSYLAMFPQLVAGPIVRARDLLQQLTVYKIPDALQKWNSIKLISYGLFQKTVVADNLSYFVDSAFDGKSEFQGSLYWWMVILAFSFQIYMDFSGYSLIARGISKYMGYHLKMNFNHPYLAKSMQEFWQRWHISLSTWFRDYVYIPLGGSRQGAIKAAFALTITMLISGLWHGANYTFLMWAILHSVWLLIERNTVWKSLIRTKSMFLMPVIFFQVTISWVFFRAVDIGQANKIFMSLFSFNPTNLKFFETYYDGIFFLSAAVLIELFILNSRKIKALSSIGQRSGMDVVFVSISILSILFLRGEGKQFIYFQF